MKNKCDKCGRKFPWGISSQDGVCFICRWPSLWSKFDEATYTKNLKARVNVALKGDKEEENETEIVT